MKFATAQRFALSLPDVTEQPHHHMSSFRVRGKIFVTVPTGETHLHIFVPDEVREPALGMYPAFASKLLWGGKVVGLKVTLDAAPAAVVKDWIRQAWAHKAPKTLVDKTSR